ncbi:MAG: ABC transporter permease [Bacillota bacterium]
MFNYVVRRLLYSLAGLLGVVVITFFLSHILPGDPAQLMAGGTRARPEVVAQVRQELGLDQPVTTQFVRYVSGLFHGDLGFSIQSRRPVSQDLRRYMPATVELAVASIVIVALLGVPLGVWAAVRRDGLFDQFARVLSVGGVSMPVFWFALLAQLAFYRTLHWLPVGGRLSLFATPPPHITGMYLLDAILAGNWATAQDAAVHLVMPAFVLAMGSLAVVVRMVRGSVLEVMRLDYVRTARAKGLPNLKVIFKHVLRNAVIPVITVLGLQFGSLLSGAVLIEVVFNWPGIGLYAVQSVTALDYQPILGVTILIGLVYVTLNLIVDVLYAQLDPRIRLS